MTSVDWIVLAIFLITSLGIGLWAGRGQKDSADYFLGKRNLPWWAVSFSVVATETSVLTFIGIPAIAYAGNLQFWQVTIGYVLGRYLVARYLIPAYFAGNISTTYEFLGQRFDANLRRFSSLVFVVTRILADGVRLFATAIPLKMMTGISYPDAILLIGVITIIYTLAGGIRSVIWMDVMQLGIYIGGAVIALGILLSDSPNFTELLDAEKLRIFTFSGGNYTLILSVFGGMFLSMASHGTDHLMVQRLLTCKSEKESRKALIASGWIVMAQFALFLIIGALLWQHFHDSFAGKNDEIFPFFILNYMPVGIRGLLIASLFAAAMSTLSSSVNSLASTITLDWLKPKYGENWTKISELKISRLVSFEFGILLIGGATFFTGMNHPIVELGLGIASFTYGPLLGIFAIGLWKKEWNPTAVFAGMIGGIVTMIFVITQLHLFWLWFVMIGMVATIISAFIFQKFGKYFGTISVIFVLFFTHFVIARNEMTKQSQNVLTGLEILQNFDFEQIAGKRVGVICNQTSVNRDSVHIVDLLQKAKNVELVAIFSPEHGLFGQYEAGEEISNIEYRTPNIEVFSLYGKTKKPTPEMLKNLDVLIYDIQDIGVRYYTYISTMTLAMEACAENGKKFIILDRPNPLRGDKIEGPVLKPEFASFVGMHTIPVRYGMTVGELAMMINGESWLKNGIRADLKVIQMENWEREMWFDETGLSWIPPSPNIPNLETALVYAGTCLFEGTNLSEGRGTEKPFLIVGSPFAPRSAQGTQREKINGKNSASFAVSAVNITFTPQSIPGKSEHPKHENQLCYGYEISVLDRDNFKPVEFGVKLLREFAQNPNFQFLETNFVDKLWGSDDLRKGNFDTEIWQKDLEEFAKLRERYLVYKNKKEN